MQRGDDAGVGEQITDAIDQSFLAYGKFMSCQQRKGGFKASETKCRKKENADEQSELRLRERVRPLIQFWPRDDMCGIWLSAFAENKPAENEIRRTKNRGDKSGRLFAVKNFN